MLVVVVGSMRVDLHGIARALGRVLDAVVLDGDRLQSMHRQPEDAWAEALAPLIVGGRPRVLPLYGTPTAAIQRALRRCADDLRWVMVHNGDPDPSTLSLDANMVVVDMSDGVEAVATRVIGRLLQHDTRASDPNPA